MSNPEHGQDAAANAAHAAVPIAGQLVAARREGRSLDAFPGTIPPDLVAAYAVQDAAIALWPDTVVGWKVGYIGADRRDASGDDRLLGPIFRRNLWTAHAGVHPVPVFPGGFAALEAEYVFVLLDDAPAGKREWSAAEVEAFPAALHIGVEVASSPLALINVLGPRVVVSDFGNNNGLVLGAEIADWHAVPEASLTCQTAIGGVQVGDGGARRLPGGLRAALAFALGRSAARGRPLKRGDLIASGNATGIHDIAIGETGRIHFDGYGEIQCRAVAAERAPSAGEAP